MIDVEACASRQDLVQGHVFLRIRDIIVVVQCEPSGIHQRVLLIVVPQQLEQLASLVAIHQ
jgi:hypothetical protein